MEATFEQELNAVVCNVTGAIDNNEPIVKAKLIDCKAVDSFQVNLPSVSMRKIYKMRYKIITKFNLNINDSIVESDDAIGSYPLIPAWDTVVFIKYKNKWNQDATDCWNRKYGKVKIDLIINMSKIQIGDYKPIWANFDLVSDIIEQLGIEYSASAKMKNRMDCLIHLNDVCRN